MQISINLKAKNPFIITNLTLLSPKLKSQIFANHLYKY